MDTEVEITYLSSFTVEQRPQVSETVTKYGFVFR